MSDITSNNYRISSFPCILYILRDRMCLRNKRLELWKNIHRGTSFDEGEDESWNVFNPFVAPLCPRPAGGLIVLRRINYHLLSTVAEAHTKRKAPALASWKRNPLVARCDTNADAEVDATAEQYARGCTATSPTMAATTRHRRRDALQSLQLFTDWRFILPRIRSARLCDMRSRKNSKSPKKMQLNKRICS